MKPVIALILCVVFVVVILYKDIKSNKYNSFSLFIPTFWFLIIFSRPLGSWVYSGSGGSTVEDVFSGSPLDRNTLSLLIICAFIILLRRKTDVARIFRNNKWLFVLILYCGVSVIWSDYPLTATKRFFKGIGSIMMVLVVLTEPHSFEAVKIIIRRCAYVLIPFSILLIKYYRHLGVFYGPWGGEAIYGGVTSHKNQLGRLCLVVGFYFFYKLTLSWKDGLYKNNKYDLFLDLTFCAMISWLLLIADSATSLVSLIIAVSTFMLLRTSFYRNAKGFAPTLLIITFSSIILIIYSFGFTESIIESLGRDTTLTDRTLIWADVLELVKNPFIGTGYDSFWLGERLEIMWEKWWFKPNETHNGYIDTYIELGFLGLFILFFFVMNTYKNIKQTFKNNYTLGLFQLPYLIMFLTYNITEASIKLRSSMFLIVIMVTNIYAIDSDSNDVEAGKVEQRESE